MTTNILIPSAVVAYDMAGLLDGTPGWRRFADPVEIVQAMTLDEVPDALATVEQRARAGYIAAGFVTYEAAPAFDPALHVHQPGPLPLLWFGIYRASRAIALPVPSEAPSALVGPWRPSITAEDYAAIIQQIKSAIADGETYQVNYTWRLSVDNPGDPWALFLAMCRAQGRCFGMYLDLGAHVLCSASPELFFLRQQSRLTCRPMKGTIGRGHTSREDDHLAQQLLASEKDRAENVMIVDMVRNDLGKISAPGAVTVPQLFKVEQYHTVWQMTSTVTADTDASLPAIFQALFPCASITGAPKIRTSHIIAELESSPRGIYTGGMGFVAPGGDAQFNVAIRTVHLDRDRQRLEYGVGSGVTWDSSADTEYRECLTKTQVLTACHPAFQLLETLLWTPEAAYVLLEQHLDRLCASARYFGIPLAHSTVTEQLATTATGFDRQRYRVRCLVDEDGTCRCEYAPLEPIATCRRIMVAPSPIDPRDRFLYHKTTASPQRAYRPVEAGVDDLLLWNPNGELTESTVANVVFRFGDELVTPPVTCGLLAGTLRDNLLARHRIVERVIRLEELTHADAVYLINSVRGWMPTVLQTDAIIR